METGSKGKRFRRITIIGTGAVGCSIGCLVRGKNLADEIVGVDKVPAHLEMARRLGFIDRGMEDPARGVMGADAVVLSIPLDEMFIVMEKAGADMRPGAMVTCTAGTTLRVWNQIMSNVSAVAQYIPSFPQVYSAACGPGAASISLLEGRRCIVARCDKFSEEAVQGVVDFWKALAMRVDILDMQQFEWSVAGSHFWPHLLISSVAEMAKERSLLTEGSALQQWLDGIKTEVDLHRSYQLYSSKLSRLLDDLGQNLQKIRRKLGGKPDEQENQG